MIILGTKYIFLRVLDYLVIFGNTHRLWELMAEIIHCTQNGEKMGAVEIGLLGDERWWRLEVGDFFGIEIPLRVIIH